MIDEFLDGSYGDTETQRCRDAEKGKTEKLLVFLRISASPCWDTFCFSNI
jgi:hypothetical protein